LIIDLEKFLARERPAWGELEQTLRRMDGGGKLDLAQARRLHYLYERASSALGRVQTFSGDPETREYLESLVARAYGLIHSADRPRRRLRPIHWFIVTFPRTFRRHFGSFLLATAATLVGALFGGVAVAADEEAKSIILPFEHLMGDPSDRVAQEEQTGGAEGGGHSTFAAMLIQNNVRVSFMALALGFTWGLMPAMLGRTVRTHHRAWLLLPFGLGAGLLLLAPRTGIVGWSVQPLIGSDKAMHGVLGFYLAMVTLWVTGRRSIWMGLGGVALAALSGGAAEMAQQLAGRRSAEWADWGWHAAGCAMAMAPYLLMAGARWCESEEVQTPDALRRYQV